MAFNTSGATGVALDVLGGWVTEMSSAALPPGVSPDNQDCGYLPGSVYSRPCLSQIPLVLTPALPGGAYAVYGKSFITPSGDIQNLWGYSNGAVYMEDWSNAPGSATLLFTAFPGNRFQSITAFGREWIATSDGLHGTYPPVQWDGVNLRRVTTDAPGAPPTIVNLALPSSQMASSGDTLTRMNNQVLARTATAHGLKVGYQAQISNVPSSNASTVNQSAPAATITYNNSVWDLNRGQYRSLFNPGTSALSDFVATGLGFTIPGAAIILGIQVSFGINSQATTTGTVNQVQLWKSGSGYGTAKSPGTAITTTITTVTYGGAGDVWGAAPTPAIVNDPTFGFAISVAADSIRDFLNFPFQVTVYYTLSNSGAVASVSSIVIDNEQHPGLALVTTTAAHGLIPGIDISLVGVEPGTVANIASGQWSAGLTTITTATPHNLIPGTVIQVNSATTSTGGTAFSFNGSFTVQKVPSPTQIVYAQAPITATDPDVINATASTGNITLAWPIPDTPQPTYFEVDSCPTATTFYIAVNYADGTWTTGSVGFAWEGTFYVTAVPSATTFYYYQPGPNGATTAVGTVTPFGQMAPGLHLVQVLFETDQGAITAPSPFVTFIANGGQYPSLSNIPIGPPNTVRRIIQFTGAQPDVPGELPPFFYIPVQAELEGLIVSTSTVIDDNTTTSAVFDFSDNTLFASIATSITGNNLANQFVLEGALQFGYNTSRLRTWGQRNTINNFLNLGFGGGYLSDLTAPLGWTVNPTYAGSGVLVNTSLGMAWQITAQASTATWGNIYQNAAYDSYGSPILEPDTLYKVRFRATVAGSAWTSGPVMFFTLTSASTSLSLSAFVAMTVGATGYYEAVFSAKTPLQIPNDLLFGLFLNAAGDGSTTTATIDEISVIPDLQPYLDTQAFASYVDNPEGMDADTGNMQPTEDVRKLMSMGIIRGSEYWLSQDPSGKLHEVIINPTSEPSGWEWREVSANCGTLSAFGLALSQATDDTAAGGDDWFAWPSESGVMMFDGAQPEKISQEIQQAWSGQQLPGTAWPQINMAAATTISTMNDPVERIMYFFLPLGSATIPSTIYPLYYKELNTARAIMMSPPFHPSLSGKLIATDNTRKWTRWNLPMMGAARIYRSAGKLSTVMLGGTYGHVYTLDPAKLTDDNLGQMYPYYVTHFFLDPQQGQVIGLTSVRLLLAYLTTFISGVGNVTYSFLVNSLTNVWPLSTTRTLSSAPTFDQEGAGGNAQGNRIAIKISVAPLPGTTDVQFNLQRLQAFFKAAKLKIRGSM